MVDVDKYIYCDKAGYVFTIGGPITSKMTTKKFKNKFIAWSLVMFRLVSADVGSVGTVVMASIPSKITMSVGCSTLHAFAVI